MQTIPLLAIPAQRLQVNLNGQQVGLSVYQKSTGLFIDVSLAGSPIVSTQLCLNRVLIVRYAYLHFAGDLAFFDVFGQQDPDYTGLYSGQGSGGRYQLTYLEPSEIVPV